ncbi:tRNA (adenosine(37)-N6)-dimethylallyltransferase MiaA [Rhodothermaceae bacterium RA]|nr:tRNA (adenosine(37)-N6)-dimethylallyltransferase MiaA [Rhodothermaceae bacterium RA]
MNETPVLILAGPTAVGKTELSLQLAEHTSAEIVSADSRQVYRRLDIGTAKPTPEELARVRHHFIDELDLDEPFSAGRFAEAAWERIREIHARGRAAHVVGGSTLYLYALQHGLAKIPTVSAGTRATIEERLSCEGADALYRELQSVDPEAAATMDPTKTQRLVRALEVFHETGQPISSFQRQAVRPPFAFRTVVLTRDRHVLYDRINRRVDLMLEAGLLDEVAGLLEAGFEPSLNPLRTIGYQEPIRYLQGEISREEMVRLIKRNTRRYAKRQLTWFRRLSDVRWVDVSYVEDLNALLQ